MVARVATVAFEGANVLDIDAQVQLSAGIVAFNIVGLRGKAVAARVTAARQIQAARYQKLAGDGPIVRTNAEADGELLERVAAPDAAGRALLTQASEYLKL